MKNNFEFKKFIRVFAIALILLVTALSITNPAEVSYLKRISDDYGQLHGGMKFSAEDLLRLGTGDRTNYGILSHYQYHFGNIKVEYIGLAGSIYYLGTETSTNRGKTKVPEITT